MNTWERYLEWRQEKGYTGLSTEDQYNEFLSQVGEQPESEKLSRKELNELDEKFANSQVKDKVAQTFEAIRNLVTVGITITYDDLAKFTGQNLRTVKRHVDELQEKGFLYVKRGTHTNTYYYGVDMRDLSEKKGIHFVDTFDWSNGIEDIAGEVTFVDGSGEVHVAIWNAKEMLTRAGSFFENIEEASLSYIAYR
ncbi:TPA: winged helix-turn-helix transcriptional regulator [Bacillus mycoides]|uniref:winged helix-turn-helix transcriptional regulator n=1 Tax=Bacillus mycoides TaxID=1405 RepID=UPI003310C0B8|nr:winged helix-turn-helix transcriptional regulator [Bacillus mycoides]